MRRLIRLICVMLALLLSANTLNVYAYAAPEKILTLETARSLAVTNDNKIKLKLNQVTLKKIKRDESIAKAKAKARNLQTFRWTPLLSFKFPQKLDLTMDYTLMADPDVIKSEIDKLSHEADDLIYAALDKVTKLYIEIYIGQENIAFTQSIYDALLKESAKNKARLLMGEAKQSDIDLIDKALEASKKELAALMGNFYNNKLKMKDIIGQDITTGYRFKSPLKTFLPTRNQLDDIIKWTLGKDHQLYSANQDVFVAKLNLNVYKQLYRWHYGYKLDRLNTYISAAENGLDIKSADFTKDYNAFLQVIDAPWQGSWVIIKFWFIKISVPKEWIKGQIDGIRYIEDEPFALYTACMDLSQAIKEQKQTQKELTDNINAQYQALVSARNSVNGLIDSSVAFSAQLDKLIELNKQGKASFSEVKDKRDDYQGIQKDLSGALADYNILLSAFDRLCCGGLQALLTDAGQGFNTGGGITSYIDKPSYSIYTGAADMVFEFSVHMPDDFEPAASHFEIWYEDVMLGQRTPVEQQLRHLKLDYGETNELTVKLYKDDAYVGECVIDTTIASDILEYGAIPLADAPKPVAYYNVETNELGGVAVTKLSVKPIDKAIAFYRVDFLGQPLLTKDYTPVADGFSYLALLVSSLTDSNIEFYDIDKNLLYTATFDETTQELYKT